jgi:hypothetical protein
LFAYPEPGKAMPLGEGRVYFPEAKQLLIITFGNGVPMSLRAARDIEAQTGAKVRVLDLRWLQPLNTEQIVAHAAQCDAILVVDEGRRSAGVGEGIITAITEGQLGHKPLQRVVGADCFTPLGDAAGLVLPSEQDIVDAGLALCQTPAEDDDDAAEAVLVDAADSEALVSDTSESDALINDTVADTSTVEATEADSAEAATDHVESVEPEAESAVIIEESMTTVAANDPAVVVLSETDTAPTIDHAETQTETATEIDSDDSSTDD